MESVVSMSTLPFPLAAATTSALRLCSPRISSRRLSAASGSSSIVAAIDCAIAPASASAEPSPFFGFAYASTSAPALTPLIGRRQWKSGISFQMSSFSEGDELWFITTCPRPAAASWNANDSSGASRWLAPSGSYSIGMRSRSFWLRMA